MNIVQLLDNIKELGVLDPDTSKVLIVYCKTEPTIEEAQQMTRMLGTWDMRCIIVAEGTRIEYTHIEELLRRVQTEET